MEQGLRFKAMYASLGLSVDDAANFLQVTPRTVQLWISGRVRVPYAAYKLMRLQLRYELPGSAWDGWHLSAGRLYTPEGYELVPKDFEWWSLLVRQARCFSSLYAENGHLRAALALHRGELATHGGSDEGARSVDAAKLLTPLHRRHSLVKGGRFRGAQVNCGRCPHGNHGENTR